MTQRNTVSRRKLLGGVAAGAGVMARWRRARRVHDHPEPSQRAVFPVAINDYDWDMTHVPGHRDRAEGEVVEIVDRVLDSTCKPLRGAILDIWQANAGGRYLHPRDPSPAPVPPIYLIRGASRTPTGPPALVMAPSSL